ncbi:MAG: CBS domain-containing protein [Chloroflexota bacterium]
MRVAEVMTKDVVVACPEATVKDVAELMERKNVGTVIITDADGKLEGIVTDRKLVTDCVAKGCNPSECKVEEIMTGKMPGPLGAAQMITATPDMDVIDAARKLGESGIRRMPVVEDGGKVVGVVSASDLAEEVMEAVDGLLEELSKTEH